MQGDYLPHEPAQLNKLNKLSGWNRTHPLSSLRASVRNRGSELVCPLGTPSFPPGMHDYDTKRHDLIERVSKWMISREEAQAKSNEYHEAHGSHDEIYTDVSKMKESRRISDHQPPFPGWWDNLLPTVQKTARQQHHLCCWGYSHHSGTELLPTHGSSSSRCISLLWLNVLFADNWGWRHPEPFYLSYHEPALVIRWQGHTCPLLLDTKPLWHRGKWKSGPTWKRDPWSRLRPIGKCPLYKFEATGQLLHSSVGSNQVGCSCTWQRCLFRETNTGTSKEIPAVNQSWRGCNHPTSDWSYKCHKVPYHVPRTADCLSPLWSNTDHLPYAPGVCSVTGMSWRILHSRLIEYALRENSRDLHSGIPARNGILLSDMMQYVNFNWPPDLDNMIGLE